MINVGTIMLLFIIQKIKLWRKNPAQPAEFPVHILKIPPM